MSPLELVDGAGADDRLIDDEVAGRLDADRRLRIALARLAEQPTSDQDVFVLGYPMMSCTDFRRTAQA